jgi:oligoribonuclease NrnB/cAMP/cGMP phosphodiesterase (DHH superfamily)
MTYEETIEKLKSTCPLIPEEKLKAVKKIITHGGKCPDGKATAMILQDAYHGQVPIEFVVHGSKEHAALEPEEGLLFCDFCVPEDKWEAFLEAGAIVLDHHKGVKDICLEFVKAGQGAFADEKDHPGIAGATLAYEYVHAALVEPDKDCKELGRIAGIRDTWQKDDPEWERACKQAEALAWWPNEHLLALGVDWDQFLEVGDVLWEKKLTTAQKVADRSYKFSTKAGTRVALFQGMRMSSDTAEKLENIDLVIGYDLMYEDGKFKMGFSTRSRLDYDCRSLAQAHGGGGHTKAAGFNVPLDIGSAPNPFRVAQVVLDAYEGGWFDKLVKWWSL